MRQLANPARWNGHVLALLLVVLLGAALRVFAISDVPPELVADEIDLYNSAQSIATTGHDVDGVLLPFVYASFMRHPPMYAVAGYVSSLVLGNGPLGFRFPAVVFGALAIALAYGIVFELTRRRGIALATAVLIATAPIFIHFSRIAWEPASELPFLLGGIYVLIRAFNRQGARGAEGEISAKALSLAAILLALDAYTYMAAWFYAVALAGAIVVLNLPSLRTGRSRSKLLAAIALWLLVAAPALWMWFGNAQNFGRTMDMSTFHGGITSATLRTFAFNYVAHFRWSYLVTTGDPIPGETWRYLVGFGAFYWWTIPLAAIGVVFAYRYTSERWGLVWLWFWLAVYPLGGSLTNEGVPNAPRTLAGAPVLCIFAAIGLATAFGLAGRVPWRQPRSLAIGVLTIFFAANLIESVVGFAKFYYTQYGSTFPNAWDSGTRSTFAVIRDRAHDYDRLCFSVRPQWYPNDTFFRYYLGDLKIEKITDVDQPRCSAPGTLLVTDEPVERRGFRTLAGIVEIGTGPFAVVAGRPRLTP